MIDAVGVTTILEPVPFPAQVYKLAPVAVRVTVLPTHIVGELELKDKLGKALTVIELLMELEHPFVLTPLIINIVLVIGLRVNKVPVEVPFKE